MNETRLLDRGRQSFEGRLNLMIERVIATQPQLVGVIVGTLMAACVLGVVHIWFRLNP